MRWLLRYLCLGTATPTGDQSDRVGGRNAMNLTLEKGERVPTGGKARGMIGGEAGEVTGVVANALTTDGLEKKV